MKKLIYLLFLLIAFAGCPNRIVINPDPTPVPIVTPTSHVKEMKIVKVGGPVGNIIDYKVFNGIGYVLRQNGTQLFLSTFDGNAFKGEELVTSNCTSNSPLFAPPRLIANDKTVVIAWSPYTRKANGITFMQKDLATNTWSSPKQMHTSLQFEYLDLQLLPNNTPVVIAEWVDGGNFALLTTDLQGKKLSEAKKKTKTMMSNNGSIFGRFSQVFAGKLDNNGAISFTNYPFYMVVANGFMSQEGYYISGWTKDVEKKLPNGTSTYWKQILSVLTPTGLVDVLQLQEAEGLTATNATGVVKLGEKIFVICSVNSKIVAVDLNKNKQEIGSGKDILVQQANDERFDIVTSGSIISMQLQ